MTTTPTGDRWTSVVAQLQPILSSVLRQELGKRTFDSLLTADRGRAMEQIRQGLVLRMARHDPGYHLFRLLVVTPHEDRSLYQGFTVLFRKIGCRFE